MSCPRYTETSIKVPHQHNNPVFEYFMYFFSHCFQILLCLAASQRERERRDTDLGVVWGNGKDLGEVGGEKKHYQNVLYEKIQQKINNFAFLS